MRPTEGVSQHVSSLRDYVQIARRRKWLVIVCAVIVPLLALAYSLQKPASYEATAQVLLSQTNLGNQVLTGSQTQVSSGDPADRLAETQAQLARVPNVAQRAINRTHSSLTPAAFLAMSSVSAGVNADLLTFAVFSNDPVEAAQLATAYAHAYVAYRLQVENAPILAARHDVEARIAKTPHGPLYNSLVEKEQTLEEMAALRTSDATVVRVSETAKQIGPKPFRNTILGLFLGLLLGGGLVFLREALDTRVRSAEAIAERLGLPLLARLPVPPKKLRDSNHLAMLYEPKGVQAEAFRMLRTNIEFAALGKDVQTIMVTSAVEKEGKSTTIANLAVALARAGQRVVLVDLDLRRPFVDRFFDLRDHAGLTQVAIGHVSLDEALATIQLPSAALPAAEFGSAITGSGQVKIIPNSNGHANGNGNGNGRVGRGSLQVLSSGPIPPDPGEFVGTARLTEILEQLRDRADVVLVDAPPLFHVGDGLVLSAKVDAMVVVTRMEVLRRPMVVELKRLLDTMPAAKLGFVVTGAESEESYGYGHGGYYYYRPYERTEENVRA